ncbi:hypothetical protein [Candidatus Berkiella aquae]|uniref:Poly(A) polymerase I n=1 Tax=Candidatus Berkiella aquae TaxID=295108 RepID=A0A0Q9YVV1_9GAMM|nr:hypothetical protein [Candidatus Berkiella aquae]MCS5710467.1 hypothetical protein [Candidatus Berkiella aquae]
MPSSRTSSSSSSSWPADIPRIEEIAQILAKPCNELNIENEYAEEVAAKLASYFKKKPNFIEVFYNRYELYLKSLLDSMKSIGNDHLKIQDEIDSQFISLLNGVSKGAITDSNEPNSVLSVLSQQDSFLSSLMNLSMQSNADTYNNLNALNNAAKAITSEASKNCLDNLNKQFNIGYFFHFYLIKKHQVLFKHQQRVIINLWTTISQIASHTRPVVEDAPSTTLMWCSFLLPILDVCHAEFDALLKKVKDNQVDDLELDFVRNVKSNFPQLIALYPQILITLGYIYAKMGNVEKANLYIEMFNQQIVSIKERFATNGDRFLEEDLNKLEDNDLVEAKVTLTSTLISSEHLRECEIKVKELAVSFKITQPATFFSDEETRIVPFASSSSSSSSSSSASSAPSSGTLLNKIEMMTKSLKAISACNALLVKRTDENTTDAIEQTFAYLHELTLNENRDFASENIQAAIIMCEEWAKLFAVDYTEEAKPITNEWNEIIKTLIQCKDAEEAYMPGYYEALLTEMAQQDVIDENMNLALLPSCPDVVPSNFNNKFQRFMYQHARFKLEENAQHLTKCRENINIFHFVLSVISNPSLHHFYTGNFIHQLWKNIALANRGIATLLNENKAQQGDDLLEMARQHYVHIKEYFKIYQKMLNAVRDHKALAVSPACIREIRPKLFDAIYQLMTACADYVFCELHHGDLSKASEALPFCYDALKSLLNDSVTLSAENEAKLANYISDLQQLICSLYTPQLGSAFEAFVRQASQSHLPDDISLQADQAGFWQAYGAYITQPLTLQALEIQNPLMHNVILESRATVYYYVLTHFVKETSPHYTMTLAALWEVCTQLYRNAENLSKKVTHPEHRATKLLNPIERYKSYVKDLIPKVEKLKNQKYAPEIKAFKEAFKEILPFDERELDAMSFRGKRGQARKGQTQKDQPKGTQSKRAQPQKGKIKEDQTRKAQFNAPFIMPKGYVSRAPMDEISAIDGEWKSQKSSGSTPSQELAASTVSSSSVKKGKRLEKIASFSWQTMTSSSVAQASSIKPSQPSQNGSHARKTLQGEKQASTSSSSHLAASSGSKGNEKKVKPKKWKPVLRASSMRTQSAAPVLSGDIYLGLQDPGNIFSRQDNDAAVEALAKKMESLNLENSLKRILNLPLQEVDLEGASEGATCWKPIKKARDGIAKENPQDYLKTDGCTVVSAGAFNIPLDLLAICSQLHSAGFKAFINGCALHATILGVMPKDVEILTNCPREIAYQLFNYNGKLSSARNDLYLLYSGIDIVCSDAKSLKEEALTRTFKWDAIFYCPRTRRLYDPLNAYSSLHDRHLNLIKDDIRVSFIEDPMQILTAIRRFNSLNMILTPFDVKFMKTLSSGIASAPWEIRANNIKALFLRDYEQAKENYDILISHQIMPCLFSSNPSERAYYHTTANFDYGVNRFWCDTLSQIYADETKGGTTTLSRFDQVIALILFLRLLGYCAHQQRKEGQPHFTDELSRIEGSFAHVDSALANTEALIMNIYPEQKNREAILKAVSNLHRTFNAPPRGVLINYSKLKEAARSLGPTTGCDEQQIVLASSSSCSTSSHHQTATSSSSHSKTVIKPVIKPAPRGRSVRR